MTKCRAGIEGGVGIDNPLAQGGGLDLPSWPCEPSDLNPSDTLTIYVYGTDWALSAYLGVPVDIHWQTET
jgi:hypothetical protein